MVPCLGTTGLGHISKITGSKIPLSIIQQIISRHILHELQAVKREEQQEPEFEACKVLRALRHVTVNDEGTAVFEISLENASPQKHIR